MSLSIEFLIHYQCPHCGFGWATGDRHPLFHWRCNGCGSTVEETELPSAHFNLMSEETKESFVNMLMLILRGNNCVTVCHNELRLINEVVNAAEKFYESSSHYVVLIEAVEALRKFRNSDRPE